MALLKFVLRMPFHFYWLEGTFLRAYTHSLFFFFSKRRAKNFHFKVKNIKRHELSWQYSWLCSVLVPAFFTRVYYIRTFSNTLVFRLPKMRTKNRCPWSIYMEKVALFCIKLITKAEWHASMCGNQQLLW